MANSFANFASQFITRNLNPESSTSSREPLFFSFTTADGSRLGGHNSDFTDMDDPHLRGSSANGGSRNYRRDYSDESDEDEDPYLRLDEEERPQSMPLIPDDAPESSPENSPKGWLAHQTRAAHGRPRSPSVSSSSSDDSGPSPELLQQHGTSRQPVSLSLTQSLLPRDGESRLVDVFSLPDPRHVRRWKYNDSNWTAVWLAGVSACVLGCIIALFMSRKSKDPSSPSERAPISPYTTLLHTIPLLTILTMLSALAAYTHVFLLRIFVKPVMIATSVFVPATLFVSAVWAFVGSFMWDENLEPTWGETVGLRLFALVPLVLSLLTARRLMHLPRTLHTTSATLNLATSLLLANPYLLAMSPAILLVALVGSIPFMTLVFRLLLIGWFEKGGDVSGWHWHVRAWAHWVIALVLLVWLWSWRVARGVLRTTTASVVGAWYYADPMLPPPPPGSTHTIHAAITRSTQPSLGSIVLGALILTGVRGISLLVSFLRFLPIFLSRALPAVLPPWFRALPIYPFVLPVYSVVTGGVWTQAAGVGLGMAAAWLENTTSALSRYGLVYTGLTGDRFFVSAKRSRALTLAVESKSGKWKRGKPDSPLTLLTIAPLTLSFPFALSTYLFVAHTLSSPNEALGASVLAAVVTALVGMFCIGLIEDTTDTLYLCYCIDKDTGHRRRAEVFEAFEYDLSPSAAPTRGHPPPPSAHGHQQHTRVPPPQQTPPTKAPSRPQPPVQQSPSTPRQQLPLRRQASDPDIDPFEQAGSMEMGNSSAHGGFLARGQEAYSDEESEDEEGEGIPSYLEDRSYTIQQGQPVSLADSIPLSESKITRSRPAPSGFKSPPLRSPPATTTTSARSPPASTKMQESTASVEESHDGSQFYPGSGFF